MSFEDSGEGQDITPDMLGDGAEQDGYTYDGNELVGQSDTGQEEFDYPPDPVPQQDDIRQMMRESVKEALAEQNVPEETKEVPSVWELPPDKIESIYAEKLALERKVQEMAERQQAYMLEQTERNLEAHITDVVGKYKMTAAEVNETVQYLEANQDLAVDPSFSFERAALRRNPELRDRINTYAPSQRSNSGEGFVVPPGASGAGAPTAFRHTPSRGEYSDVSRHIIQSGEAARLGKYT